MWRSPRWFFFPVYIFATKQGFIFCGASRMCSSFGLLGPLHHRHRMFRRNGGGYSARGIHDFRLQRDDLRHLHDDAADVSDHPLLRLLYGSLLSRDRADSAGLACAGLRRALQLCFYESELLRILHFLVIFCIYNIVKSESRRMQIAYAALIPFTCLPLEPRNAARPTSCF